MHSYQPTWPKDRTNWEPPFPGDFTYRDARHVAEYASREPLTTWYTYPHVWHLDESGAWQCCARGSSLDSVRRWADSPECMLQCRLTSTGAPCPDYWVILEPRQKWLAEDYVATEADAEAFVTLRRSLDEFGITLLDAVVTNEEFQWWSLHELTSGTTAWSFVPSSRVG